MNNITVAVIALISGAIGSLIAPWVKWGIVKKNIKHQDRINTIAEIRNLVINEHKKFDKLTKTLVADGKNAKAIKLYPDAITYFDALNQHSIFHKIKPYLQNDTILILKNSELFKLKDRGTTLGQLPMPYEKLMGNLSEIEKHWKLI